MIIIFFLVVINLIKIIFLFSFIVITRLSRNWNNNNDDGRGGRRYGHNRHDREIRIQGMHTF